MAERPLAGRVALITGAGTGIGSGIARALAAAGADVAVHHRSHGTGAAAVADACQASGVRAVTLQADFAADPGSAAELVAATVRHLGRIDILVNNAAQTTALAPFETMSRDFLEESMAVNVTAPVLAAQAAALRMIDQGSGGRIINIGSVHARQSAPGYTAYEIGKGAIGAFTFSAAVGRGGHGITVNCVAPGAIVVERYEGTGWDEDWFISRTPVGRNGTPADIAATVRFLCTDEASFITGETIHVDGGMTRRMPLVR